MRAFLILSVIAVASAGRLGYNYRPGVSGDYESSGSGISPVVSLGKGQGSSFSSGSDIGGQAQGSNIHYGLSSGLLAPSLGSGISYGSSGLSGFGSGLGSGISYGGIGSGSLGYGISYGSPGSIGSGISYQPGTNQIIDGGLNKEYYIFSAPEEQYIQGQNTQSSTTVLKKNLRVIFIKAPENTAVHNTALQIAKQASEDRTAIYVLSKEPDVSEIASQVQQISENVRAKPEVRFIKYRTPQDAINAQHSIHQQYEALGGSSQISNEGVVPVLNFASPAIVHRYGLGHGLSGHPLLASGSSISSSKSEASVPALTFGASETSSETVDLGSVGAPSTMLGVQSASEYLPPPVKK